MILFPYNPMTAYRNPLLSVPKTLNEAQASKPSNQKFAEDWAKAPPPKALTVTKHKNRFEAYA